MEILFLILLSFWAALWGRKIRELEKRLAELERNQAEKSENTAAETGGEDFESIYRKGLAGIMAYSLSQAAGEDEI